MIDNNEIGNLISAAWQEYKNNPNLRFGQAIENEAVKLYKISCDKSNDCCYYNDDNFFLFLKTFQRKLNEQHSN